MLELTHYGICSSDGQQNKDGEISVPPHGLLDKHCPGIHVDLSIKVITIISTSIELIVFSPNTIFLNMILLLSFVRVSILKF